MHAPPPRARRIAPQCRQRTSALWKDNPWIRPRRWTRRCRRSNEPSARARSCVSARTRRRGGRDDIDRLARPRYRARSRRAAARQGHRDLRAGIFGQDHADAARDRRGAEDGRHLRLRRRRARARPGLCPQARRQPRGPADLAARHRRAGAGDHRYAGALGRRRRAGHRLGRGADATRRDRRRDGRQPARPAGAPDEPGAAQADRLHLALADHGHLHQPDPHEDRRHVRRRPKPRPAATR